VGCRLIGEGVSVGDVWERGVSWRWQRGGIWVLRGLGDCCGVVDCGDGGGVGGDASKRFAFFLVLAAALPLSTYACTLVRGCWFVWVRMGC
jgi:hypothetical protein